MVDAHPFHTAKTRLPEHHGSLTATDSTTLQVVRALRLPVLRRGLGVIFPLIAPSPCKPPLFLIHRPLLRLRVLIHHLVAAPYARSHTREPTPLLRARMFPLVSELRARLPLPRVSQAGVHVTRGGTAEGGGRGRLGRFFAVVALDGGVVGLARHFGRGVGGEGAVGRGGAGGQGFGAEGWGGVVAD